ncbi:MAG: (2Fe-2S)-binding protein [Bacteroidia bacterium]
MPQSNVLIQVWQQDQVIELSVPQGKILRTALLYHGLSPYGPYTQKLNCRGNGICATCGILPMEGVPKPKHWHDRLAAKFGYPRLACQIEVNAPMSIRLIGEKGIWE